MESLDDISQRFDEACLVSGGLNKDGCKVVMAGVSDRIVVDFDRSGSPLATDMTRCDYLLVTRGKSKDMSGWVVIELKRRGWTQVRSFSNFRQVLLLLRSSSFQAKHKDSSSSLL